MQNYMQELTVQKRIDDAWYNDVMHECRRGELHQENYCFLMGLPTMHPGSWRAGRVTCGHNPCTLLCEAWAKMAREGHTWEDMCAMECSMCAEERQRRNRLATPQDMRLSRAPFLDAPYVHQNNEPKYHALLTRALEHAKRNGEGPKHVLWVVAKDTPHDTPEFRISKDQLDKKRARWLQFHDQHTSGIPGLLPLYRACA